MRSQWLENELNAITAAVDRGEAKADRDRNPPAVAPMGLGASGNGILSKELPVPDAIRLMRELRCKLTPWHLASPGERAADELLGHACMYLWEPTEPPPTLTITYESQRDYLASLLRHDLFQQTLPCWRRDGAIAFWWEGRA
jgi:hypothetical protein